MTTHVMATPTYPGTDSSSAPPASRAWLMLRDALLDHLSTIGNRVGGGPIGVPVTKEAIRRHHLYHRAAYHAREQAFIARYGRDLLADFARGDEIAPASVEPVLCPVRSDTRDSRLFRLATLLWSVPVSRGYGRRLRFLVRDAHNDKLIGLFALTDPVFNLRARDDWITWSVHDRGERLVNVMDAHVVGAVPPYRELLGGKIVASLMTSHEVVDAFAAKYRATTGIISGARKNAQLVLLTVSSSLGRSSLYNRLHLEETVHFERIGVTEGWGHFHIPDDLFNRMRMLLAAEGHAYAAGHQFGQGPNWRLRVIRVALSHLGLDDDMLRHGIAREIFASPLAPDWRAYLCGHTDQIEVRRPLSATIGRQAVQRWLVGRAERRPDFRVWTREHMWSLLTEAPCASLAEA